MKLKIFTGVILMGFFVFMTAIVIAAAMLFYQNFGNAGSTIKPEPNPQNFVGNSEDVGSEYVLDEIEVSKHNSPNDCYLIINGSVYDVSSFVSVHPGGAYLVEDYCGADATAAFNSRDKNPSENHSNFAADLLRNYYIGPLGAVFNTIASKDNTSTTITPTLSVKVNIPTTVPESVAQTSATLVLDATEVAKHNTLQNCWLIISGSIYDVTKYIYQHPGGASQISSICGTEATNAFQTMGGKGKSHSQFANSLLSSYLIGTLGSSVAVNSGTTSTTFNSSNTSDTNTQNTVPNTATTTNVDMPTAIVNKYPDATVIQGKYEDEGEWEGKVNTSAGCRAIKVSSSGNISQDEGC